ncbi:MAG: LTA synthase family protein [Lachnospiraceae bacterium]|nr:LTA synthase family protein [Lachnospiraceae bacterium]
MTRKKCFLILFPLLYVPLNEGIFSLFLNQGISIHKVTFSLLAGFFLYWFGQLTRNRRRAWLMQTLWAILYTMIYCVQVCYYTLFGTPFYLKSLSGAGDAMGDFFQVVIDTVLSTAPALLPMILLALLWLIVYRRVFLTEPYEERRAWRSLLLFTIWLCLTLGGGILDYNGATSASYMLLYDFVPTESVRTFGMLTTAILDIKYNILHLQATRQETVVLNMDEIEVETASDTDRTTESTGSEESEVSVSESSAAETAEAPDQEGAVEPAAIESDSSSEQSGHDNVTVDTTEYSSDLYNVMDIDFTREIVKEDEDLIDTEYADMNSYFSSQTPTAKNEYTGLFEGKNLILITAEAFSKYVIDPELTPTLYQLYSEGFQFENFYTPIWGVSTSDGEFVATTGLIPKAGVWSYTEVADNYMPFAFGNQFSKLGYLTLAFHNHSYTYYNRNLSYPNMGYEFYAKEYGLDLTDTWPESDVEMMQQSVSYYLNDDDDTPFHVYYMTVSGHLEYSWESNAISAKNQDRVADLEYSEEVLAYIACQLELEDALTELLNSLEEAGELENTVIALSGDHYPYGLTTEQYAELRGEEFDETFGLYENTFLLWSASMTESVSVDTYCSSLDIAPTLSNLFGLEYDSRLYIGTDIFSGTSPIVCFQDRSFITDRIMYDNTNSKIIQLDDGEVSEEYLAECIAVVKNKFYYSAKIIELDYYGYLFDESGGAED